VSPGPSPFFALNPILQYPCDEELSEHQIVFSIFADHFGLLGNVVVVESAAERVGPHIEYLGGAIAPSREPHTVLAKADTTHNALVVEVVHEADVERLGFARVVEREPVLAVLSVLGGHGRRIDVAVEFLLGAYDGLNMSGCLLWWEVAAASGGRLVDRRGWRRFAY